MQPAKKEFPPQVAVDNLRKSVMIRLRPLRRVYFSTSAECGRSFPRGSDGSFFAGFSIINEEENGMKSRFKTLTEYVSAGKEGETLYEP